MELPRLKVAILHYQPKEDEADEVVGHIADGLRGLGHDIATVAVGDNVNEILREIKKTKCDLVFNVCETFAEDYRMEVNVAALLEMGRVRYTGSGAAGLLLAQDKILTKQLLEFHGVQTPNFASFENDTFETRGTLRFPLIVKPARSDASIGIGKNSVVPNWQELTERVREIRDELQDVALAEEFIEGREMYVAVVGPPAKPEVLPIIELNWGYAWDPARPRVADREVKFAKETEGSSHLMIADEMPNELRAKLENMAVLAYQALRLRDYARLDFRISRTGDPYVLEANPNPYLDPKGEMAIAAAKRGVDYPQLLERILASAAQRYGITRRQYPAKIAP